MSNYDGLVNDYLRAVEQALAGVPVGRRDELLSDLSEHIAAKRAELTPQAETEAEVRSILDLLGDPSDLAAEAMLDTAPPEPIEIRPGRRTGAIMWVLITIASVSLLCVGVLLVSALALFGATRGGDTKPATPVDPLVPTVSVSAPAPATSPS